MGKRELLLILSIFCSTCLYSQVTNPAPQSLTYTQNFGTTTFAVMPTGMACWNGLSGGTITSQALAEASVPTGNATITATSSTTTSAGTYGYMTSSNARLYCQITSNATNGVNQPIFAINTGVGTTSITVAYTIEVLTQGSSATSGMGSVLQYRSGTTGTWTTVTGSNFLYNTSATTSNGGDADANGDIDSYSFTVTGLTASTDYQFRFAHWRNNTGSAPGIAYDDITLTAVAAAATQLALVNVPGTGTTGNPLSSFTVEGRTAGNALASGFTGTVTLTKATGPGAINGTLSASAVAGVATFNNVAFNQAGTYTITAASTGLTSATSGNVVISNPTTNVFGGDGINWVGSNQTPTAYSQPTNCNYPDYRVLKYRKVNTTGATPTDGRGQWVTTINSQASGGDVSTTNMTGGSSNGFIFTSGGGCGSTGTYGNKWNFAGTASGSLNAINGMQWTTGSGNDMGLNMSTAGKYTFVFKDAGYTSTGYYVGYTANTPVTLTHNTGTQRTQNNDGTTTILATISGTPSAQESFYVRYKTGSSDFSTGSSTISAAVSVASTTVTLSIPIQADGATVYYYIFSSTMSQSALQALSEGDKSYALLNFADNSGNNYSYTALTLTPTVTSIVPTAVTGITGQASNTGFKGQTLTITGTNFQSNATVTINGVAATSVVFGSSTSLTAVVANTGANFTGNVVVANPTPSTSVTVSSFNFLGYITASAGVINTASRWLGAETPLSGSTVTIAHAMTHTGGATTGTPFASLTIPTGGSLIINSTGAIAVTNAITITGTGSLNLNISSATVSAGSISNAGTISWTTSGGILTINAGGTFTNTGTVSSGTIGNVVFAGSCIVNGANAITFNNLTINGVTTLTTVPTINGTLQINGGNVTASPNYGAASTLFYNVATYDRYLEWAATNVNPGYPFNVTIGSSTQASAVNLKNSSDIQLGGKLTIGAASGSASSLTLDESSAGTPKPLTVVGAVEIKATGTLTLGNINGGNAGDIKVGGDWTNAGIFSPNSRAVFFNGATADQTITRATGEIFDYVIVNKATSGNLVLGTSTPVTINQTITLTKGLVVLGANNLTFGSSGTTASGSAASYIATSGAGRVLKAHTGSFVYPIGPSTTKYAPIAINNTGGISQTYTVGVTATTYTPATDGTNWQWIVSTPGTSTSDLSFSWSDAGANLVAAAATGVAYRYNGASWDAMGGSTVAGSPNITSVAGISSFTNTIWTVALPVAAPATYYNVANSDVSVLTNWGTNTNGTGTNPPSFGTANATYNLYNGTSNTLGTATIFSGTATSLKIGDGTTPASVSTTGAATITVGTAAALSGTATIAAGSTLIVTNPFTIAAGGTLTIAGNGTSNGILEYQASTASTITGSFVVNGDLKINPTTPANNIIPASGGTTTYNSTCRLYVLKVQDGPASGTGNDNIRIPAAMPGTVIWNCTPAAGATTTPYYSIISGSSTIGKLVVINTGGRPISHSSAGTNRNLTVTDVDIQGGDYSVSISATTSKTIINGNLSISGGTFAGVNTNLTGASGTGSIELSGGLTISGGSLAGKLGTSTGTGTFTLLGTTNQAINASGTYTLGSIVVNSGVGGSVSASSNVTISGNLTLTAGTLTVGANTLSITGNITRTSGLINASNASATMAFTGTAAQTVTGAVFTGNVNNLTMNNTVGSGGGLTLGTSTPITVAGNLLFTAGTITLGANNLTIGAAGSISGAASGTGFIITNSTGLLVRTSVGAGATDFPVGSAATSFTPLTLTNTTGAPNISVGSSATVTNTVVDATKIVNLQWNVTSTASSTSDITFNWNPGIPVNQAASFNNTGIGELGIYTGTGPYAISSLGTLSGTTISKSGISLAPSSNLMVIGNADAVALSNDLCSGAITIPASGPFPYLTAILNTTTATITSETAPTCQASFGHSIWYKFTPTTTGTYSFSSCSSETSTTIADNVMSLYSGTCGSLSSVICVDDDGSACAGTLASFSSSLTGGTTYYIMVAGYNTEVGNIQLKVNFVPVPPVAAAATDLTSYDFTANWNTPTGATGYKLDVSTVNTFASGATTTIASEGFENSLSLFTETTGTGLFYTGNSASGDRPATSPFAAVGTYSYGKTGGSVTITSSNINTSNYANIQLGLRLASFSIGSTGNGADASDNVKIEISPDGGTNYYSTVRVIGNSNAYWAYSATGIASTAYGTPLDYTPAGGSVRTTDGFSTFTITGLPASNSLKIRITLLNDNAAERWTIDDLTVTGNLGSFVSGYNNLSVASNSQSVTGLIPNTDYYYRVRATGAGGTSANSNTITVHTPCPAATISYTIDPCVTTGTVSVSRTGTINGTYSAPAGLSINSTTGAIDIAASTAGNYTVTYAIAAVNGCTAINATANVVIKTATWSGAGTAGLWTDANNWSCTAVPTGSFNVIIPGSLSNYPVISSGTASVNNISLSAATSAVTVTGGSLQIAGTITNSGGTFDASAGTIVFNGTTAQTVLGSVFAGRVINNLTISNTTVNISSTASDSLIINGTLAFGNVNSATLNTNDNLVLRSTSTGTARVADITNAGANSGNAITGKLTVERHIPARRAWRLLAPPITSSGAPTINASWQEGQTQTSPSPALDNNPGFGTHVTGGVTGDGFDQSPSNGSSIKYLSGGSWTNVGATNTGVITDQLAYMLFVRGSRAIDLSAGIAATPDETVLRVKGNIKQGPQTLPLAATGYNLVVNPYPSAIDMHSIALVNSGLINDNFKIWDPKIGGSNNVGGYVTVSRNGGNYDYAPDSRPSMSGTGSELSQYIQSGSAFFVDAISTGDVNVVESNKSASGSDNVNNPTTPDERMRVNLRSVNADATTPVVDGVLATYDAANTNAINGNDAGKLANFSTENLGMMRDGKELSIERREIIGTRDTIFLNMANMKQKNYQMEMTAQLLNHPNLLGYLEDSYLSTSTLLNLDGNTIYPFNVNATPASAAANRFMIVFKPNVPLPVTFTSIKAVQQTNDIAVEWKVDNQTNIKQYEVEKSTDGRSFANVGTQMATGANGTAATYNWLDVHAVSGDNFYRVKSVGFGGDVQYTRIVKVRMGKGVPAITVYPNPVTDRVVTLQFTDMVKGNYTINLVNNLGQTVQSKLISHNGANAAQSFAIDRAVAKGNYQLQIIKPGGEKEVMKLVIAE